jgi:protocatechuate 3,4-dioxygenase beta subunit
MLIKISRRALIAGLPAVNLLAQMKPTPMQTLGPFYPADRPLDQDADLTVIKGKKGRAKGELLYVMGRILDPQGKPIRGARVEVWQANAAGRYRHAADNSAVPLDPNFEGYALLTTDSEGRYQFKTIKPGSYAAGDIGMRTPHIHFDVMGKQSRLTTQMYFPGEPLNEKDSIFLETPAQERQALIAKILPPGKNAEPEAKLAVWDVMLITG